MYGSNEGEEVGSGISQDGPIQRGFDEAEFPALYFLYPKQDEDQSGESMVEKHILTKEKAAEIRRIKY